VKVAERKAILFDLDGVLYRGKKPLPGAEEAVKLARSRGYRVFFLTNNSTRTRAQYVERLRSMGIECDESDVITSGYATAEYLKSVAPNGARLFVIGEEGLKVELRLAGFLISDEEPVDFVVVGLDRKFNYEKLLRAQQAILKGAEFIATNPDSTYPTEEGLIPGAGSIVAAVERASGRKPTLIGKPQPFMLELALRLSGARREECVVVGDRLDTDILAGNRAGMVTILVLTGVTTEEEARRAEGDLRPKFIIPDLRGLRGVLP